MNSLVYMYVVDRVCTQFGSGQNLTCAGLSEI